MSDVAGKLSVSRVFLFLLAAVVAFRVGSAFFTADGSELTVWGDRDLWRALSVGSSWPDAGPEINGGMRPPGGAFYLLLAAILAIQPSVFAAYFSVLVLFAASLLLLGFVVARDINPRTGVLAAAALAGIPMLSQVLKVWNPGYLLLFATAATVFGYRFLKNGNVLPMAVAAAAIGIGLQIHLQIFQLAIALVIAAVIRRTSWSWRHTLALGLALFLPFLPSVFAGDHPLFASITDVPGGAVENYVLSGFHPLEKVQLIYGLLGGTPGIIDFASSDSLYLVRTLAMAADLFAASLAIGFLVWTIASLVGRRVETSSLFALITSIFIVVGLFSTVNERHLVAVWPAVAMMTGIAADRLLGIAAIRGSRLILLCGALAAIGLTLRPAFLGIGGLMDTEFDANSISAQSEIAATVKSTFFADRDAFEAHSALFWRLRPRHWQLVQEGISGQMTFIFQTTSAPSIKSNREECLAILPKEGVSPDVGAELSKSPAFAGLAPTIAPIAAESAHFLYFPYKTIGGNCLKSFPNAYIPSAYEADFLDPGTEAPKWQSTDAARFAVPLPDQPFPIGVELRRSGVNYQAILHGRPLRGYTGLRFQTMINPTLCFESNGDVRLVSFGQLTVGSPQRGTLAPWTSPAFGIPEGTYRLWLIGRDGKTPQTIQASLGQVAFPNLRTAPPASGDAQPAAGCPLPIPPRSGGSG